MWRITLGSFSRARTSECPRPRSILYIPFGLGFFSFIHFKMSASLFSMVVALLLAATSTSAQEGAPCGSARPNGPQLLEWITKQFCRPNCVRDHIANLDAPCSRCILRSENSTQHCMNRYQWQDATPATGSQSCSESDKALMTHGKYARDCARLISQDTPELRICLQEVLSHMTVPCQYCNAGRALSLHTLRKPASNTELIVTMMGLNTECYS